MDATGTTPDEDDENDAPRINQRRGTIVVESRGGNYNVRLGFGKFFFNF
jgi:hypothetical protein